ncbi:hypothetical protein RIR_jg9889.t1 [Rhizophagus irregularis DAOM 181602=DAOM 197198]|uniref:Uncharacterized protein n=1 Tax=Rhizophagus irregularis TaxID=588596 RepID=A0A2N1NDM1_9GLOM|nr:hypothetical protein RhiirC2_397318 [Rhizophagus irregularis]GET54918.1 hypothetical protein RIR_jg9889.t1 [Rhizophagus irregularis DAOM 181602=DAOM 197198]
MSPPLTVPRLLCKEMNIFFFPIFFFLWRPLCYTITVNYMWETTKAHNQSYCILVHNPHFSLTLTHLYHYR